LALLKKAGFSGLYRAPELCPNQLIPNVPPAAQRQIFPKSKPSTLNQVSRQCQGRLKMNIAVGTDRRARTYIRLGLLTMTFMKTRIEQDPDVRAPSPVKMTEASNAYQPA